MVNCFIIYYVVDYKLPGIFVFLWLFIFIEYYFFFKYPQFIPAAMICIVTQVRPSTCPPNTEMVQAFPEADRISPRSSSLDMSFKPTCSESQHRSLADSHTIRCTNSPLTDSPPS